MTRALPAVIALVFWIVLVSFGAYNLLAYEYSSGKDNAPPVAWPQSSGLELSSSGYTLVMMVHPHCSCTRASIGELSKLMARHPNGLHAIVLILTPKDADADWSTSSNVTAAKAIPGVIVKQDIEGAVARLFNIETSGFTSLYNDEGDLLFNGGITDSRGHWGDNTGSTSIGEIIRSGSSHVRMTPAFGCNLFKKVKGGRDEN